MVVSSCHCLVEMYPFALPNRNALVISNVNHHQAADQDFQNYLHWLKFHPLSGFNRTCGTGDLLTVEKNLVSGSLTWIRFDFQSSASSVFLFLWLWSVLSVFSWLFNVPQFWSIDNPIRLQSKMKHLIVQPYSWIFGPFIGRESLDRVSGTNVRWNLTWVCWICRLIIIS